MNLRSCCILLLAATLAGSAHARPVKDDEAVTRKSRILERFDRDGDGKLSDDERAHIKHGRRARFLERFDADGNGELDDGEKTAIRKARAERRGHRGRHREIRRALVEKFDANGDGRLDEDERAAARKARRARLLERFDANGNGELDDEEKSKLRRWHRAQRARCPRHEKDSKGLHPHVPKEGAPKSPEPTPLNETL